MKKLKKLIGFILFSTLVSSVISGCFNTAQTNTKEASLPEKVTIVQMPDENNPDAGQKHDGFRKAMEASIGVKVEELEGADYSVGIEALKNGKLDVLLVSPMSYYQAKTVANVEPLVTTATMGATPYKTVFVTKSNRNDINSINDLKGKSFAFVDPASSSGYMYPKAKLIKDLKLEADNVENPGYFFDTVKFSGKHDTSLMGVVKGDYDAAAVALQVIDGLVKAGMIKQEDIKIIGETEVIPNALFIIRADLPQDMKDKIKQFYLQYNDASYFKSIYKNENIRFIEAKDSDYTVVDEMVKILNIKEK